MGLLKDVIRKIVYGRNVPSKMTKEELLDKSLSWASEYDKELKELIEKDKEYYMNIINIFQMKR